ncbi:MAG: hypothetical protein MUF60_04640 [Vicinamibacterales bacterium]|nr:hypothetical protein [Vicinamibacterales bacterium]
MRGGADPFVTGANLPWLRYGGDFGANAWSPGGGLSRPDAAVRLDEVLARAAGAGIAAIRWFLFCDGRAGIEVDEEGLPRGLDAHVRADVDVALAALDRHGLRALFVLVDFMMLRPARLHRGVRMHGRRRWLAHADARARLLEQVVAPMAAHVTGAPALFGWDVMNEPEWATFGVGEWRPWRSVSRKAMRAFLGEAIATLRAAGPEPVTVGLASVAGLDLVRDLGLDLYQVHWYDHVDRPWTLVTPAAAHALDAPLLLGEFPTTHSAQTPFAIVSAAGHAGYAGAFAWSLCAEDAFSSEAGCFEAARYGRRSSSEPAIG